MGSAFRHQAVHAQRSPGVRMSTFHLAPRGGSPSVFPATKCAHIAGETMTRKGGFDLNSVPGPARPDPARMTMSRRLADHQDGLPPDGASRACVHPGQRPGMLPPHGRARSVGQRARPSLSSGATTPSSDLPNKGQLANGRTTACGRMRAPSDRSDCPVPSLLSCAVDGPGAVHGQGA